MKQVRETAAAKTLSVYVVLKKGEIVATIQSHHSNSGVCTVDVWGKTSIQYQGRAAGFGYDKFTAALSGAVIEGVPITDHCGGKKVKFPKGLDHYPTDFKPPKGYYLCNGHVKGYSSCYRKSGLDILYHYGIKVKQVL